MEIYYIIFCAVILPLVNLYQPHEARHYLFALGSATVLLYVVSTRLFYGDGSSVLHMPDLWVAGFGVCTVMSCAWATNAREALSDGVVWAGCLVLYFAAGRVNTDGMMLALFAPAVLMTPMALYQAYSERRHGHVIEIDGLQLVTMPSGMFGNTNFFGVYLAVVFFAGLWLSENVSPWFYAPLSLVAICLVLTKCRAAWVGCSGGLALFCYLNGFLFEMAILLIAGGVAFMTKLLKAKGSPLESSGTARISFFLNALKLIRQRPLFGWGLRSFRVEQYYAHRDLAAESESLGKKSSAPTDRIHNDYLEIGVETGLAGLILFGVFLVHLPWSADPCLSGGLASMLVSAMFFFPFYTMPTAVAFWCFAGAAASRTPAEITLDVPVLIYAVLAACFLGVVWQVSLFKLIALMIWHHRANRAQNVPGLLHVVMKCLKYDPYNSEYLINAYQLTARRRPDLAVKCATRLLEHFDGNVPLESIEEIQPKIANRKGD